MLRQTPFFAVPLSILLMSSAAIASVVEDMNVEIKVEFKKEIEASPSSTTRRKLIVKKDLQENLWRINHNENKQIIGENNCLPCSVSFLKWVGSHALLPEQVQDTMPQENNIYMYQDAKYADLLDKEHATQLSSKPTIFIGDEDTVEFIKESKIKLQQESINDLPTFLESLPLCNFNKRA
jgi:hypothetical protein